MNSDGRTDWYSKKRFMVEAIGTFCITYFPWLAMTFLSINLQNAVSVALCSGAIVTAWAWLARERSGGHFNPALTLAYMYVKEIPITAGLLYMLSQFTGAIFAGGVIYFQLSDQSSEMEAALNNVSGWAVGPLIRKRDAFILEMLATMFMTFSVLNTVLDKKSTPESYAIVYGGITCMISLAFSTISGGFVNPAKMIGPSSALYEINEKVFVIGLAQFVGGMLGGVFWNELFNRNKAGQADNIIDFFSKYDDGNEDKGLVSEGGKNGLEDFQEMQESKLEAVERDLSDDQSFSSQKLMRGETPAKPDPSESLKLE